ncbi:MAG: ABC transporter substrate-binding protein [Lachnospiraceae bacterium]|jgi:multiple sugar transport system substrate-binding protein|nr:ABC transporter substrate-binding protein [Lachnospiraceae bacterium]MCH4108074.1 ABC transporter substrate-binding protein [Lachnospiraceae bacterium]MCI1331955.1 ABC transporter substrate-binding protein [Lachnospiraceae bacterium]MCI1360637.1 ABC transporter substrate-binding protein [Lachnospiraceae bacterium]MCI1380516.1 ABC transporter substrate-binding protein [Lachnospiraceae bacterium]
MKSKEMKTAAISVLLAGSLLAGCGSVAAGTSTTAGSTAAQTANASTTAAASGSEKAMTLTVAWWGNQVRTDRTTEILNMYSEKHPNVSFDVQPSSWSDYFTKISTAVASQNEPDVLQLGYNSYLPQYASNGALLDLQPYVDSGALDVSSIDQSILDSGTIDGKLVAICAGVNVPAMMYNKTLTDSLGITIKDQMTIDEFEEVCRQIYEKSGVRTDLAYGNSESMMQYIMRGEGMENMFADGKLSADDSSAFVPFFKIYEDGLKEGWMLDAATYAELTLNSVEQSPLIYFSSPETESWCACNWSNQLTAFKKSAPEGMDIAYTTWPASDPKKADYLHPSQYFSCGAHSKNPDEAVAVLNYIINDVDANKVLLAERGIPAASTVANAISSDLSEENQAEIKFIQDVVTPNSSTITPIGPTQSSEVFKAADTLVEQVLYGQTSAEDASAQFFMQASSILGG